MPNSPDLDFGLWVDLGRRQEQKGNASTLDMVIRLVKALRVYLYDTLAFDLQTLSMWMWM